MVLAKSAHDVKVMNPRRLLPVGIDSCRDGAPPRLADLASQARDALALTESVIGGAGGPRHHFWID